MNIQAHTTKEVPTIPTDVSEPFSSGTPSERKLNLQIPWSVYFSFYFIQGVVMQMLMINVAVYLYQTLDLDWYPLTVSFIVMILPVLLRPLFAFAVDKHPTSLSPLLVIGVILVFTGSTLAGISTLAQNAGLVGFTIGFSAGIVGATILNVIMDSHIVRAIPLDKSAKVNSYKKVSGFLGGAISQFAYIFLVGKLVGNFSGWAIYFSVPAMVTAGFFLMLILHKRSWRVLPDVAGLPPLQAQWLESKTLNATTSQNKPLPVALLVIIMFLFFLPDGLLETSWENFIIGTYGLDAWFSYSALIVVFGIISIAGFIIARRSGKRAPEWDLFWYSPMVIAYYVMLLLPTPFEVVIGVTTAFQILNGFIQIRILQSMQSHSYFKKAGLSFQIFMMVFQGGKFVGIGLSGWVMTVGSYSGLFGITILIWSIIFALTLAYWMLTRGSKSPPQ